MKLLHEKLNAGLDELLLRMKQGTMKDIQRIYGYCLGLHVACYTLDADFFSTRMDYYLKLDIGQRSLKELRMI